MSDIYELDLVQSLGGQELHNILYYQNPLSDLPGFGTNLEALCEQFTQTVLEEPWVGAVSSEVKFIEIRGRVYGGEGLELYNTFPIIYPLSLEGTRPAEYFAQAAYVNMRASFDPQTFLASLVAPRRGYICVGGLAELDVTAGRLAGSDSDWLSPLTIRGKFRNLGVVLGQNLTAGLSVYWPVRVKTILAGAITGVAQVQSFVPSPIIRWRASRKPEA